MAVKHPENKESYMTILREAGDKLVIVDFYADWCGPCKMIGPKVVKMAEEYPDVVVVKVNVDELEDVAAEAGVSAMPTFHAYRNCIKIDEVIGASEPKVRELFSL